MKVKIEGEAAQLCPTPGNPIDCSLLGSFVHGIFQARVLEWAAIALSHLWDLPGAIYIYIYIITHTETMYIHTYMCKTKSFCRN